MSEVVGGEAQEIAVTRRVADGMAALFDAMVARGVAREQAQRSTIACVHALFAGERGHAAELTAGERGLVDAVGREDWSRVEPAIFGALFQSSMGRARRHALGAHFTSEADIYRVVLPTIVGPWQRRIDAAPGAAELAALREELARFKILDPACGSGNFLCVAYRELVRLELRILRRSHGAAPERLRIGLWQIHGLEIDGSAVALARSTLLLARDRAHAEARGIAVVDGPADSEREALERNIVQCDALLSDWPPADAIVGNPPFQAKNKLQAELGLEHVRRVRARYPEVSGKADYCVYWFRRAHDELRPGGRAGLVGTNTIRQNASREGGLDHIVRSGTIVEAVASEVWSGDAAVNVSIVSWLKGAQPGKKRLSWQEGDSQGSPWQTVEVDEIHAALSPRLDVTAARPLRANRAAGVCYQGQTPGSDAFLVAHAEAQAMAARAPEVLDVLFPFLIGDDLLGRPDGGPGRWVIDFQGQEGLAAAARYAAPFDRVARDVRPGRERRARAEAAANAALRRGEPGARVNRHHQIFGERWWQLSWPRPELIARLAGLPRYIVCVRATRRPIFAFVDAKIRPGDALQVFALADDYAFGVLQSDLHWRWFVERCSTLKRDFRYTSSTVFDAFPWPQAPTLAQVRAVADAGRELRELRDRMRAADPGLTLRRMYRALEGPGAGPLSPLREAHAALDAAVRAAHGVAAGADGLAHLLAHNLALAAREGRGELIAGPGLPAWVDMRDSYVTGDRVGVPTFIAEGQSS